MATNIVVKPFFTTKPTGQGTGLGLSLSYEIEKDHSDGIKIDQNKRKNTKSLIILHMLKRHYKGI